jgi:hypothetical protein
MPEVAFLFILGAAASLIGDHSHVATGTTEYLTDAVPFIWSSPIWFPIAVGAATVSLAELRLRLRVPRESVTVRRRGGDARRNRRQGPAAERQIDCFRHASAELTNASRAGLSVAASQISVTWLGPMS